MHNALGLELGGILPCVANEAWFGLVWLGLV